MKSTTLHGAVRASPLENVQSVGSEMALNNMQVNAIAQGFGEKPSYWSPEVEANPKFQQRFERDLRLGWLVAASKDAKFAAWLSSERANCVGVLARGALLKISSAPPTAS